MLQKALLLMDVFILVFSLTRFKKAIPHKKDTKIFGSGALSGLMLDLGLLK